LADVGKIHVASDEGRAGAARASGNLRVGSIPQGNVAGVFAGVAEAGQQCQRRARHVGVHEEAHGLRGERMEGFLFGQFAHEFEGGADVFHGEVVFLPQLLKGHAAGEAAHDERNGHPRATDDGLAVADGRINDNAFVSVHGQTDNLSAFGFQGGFEFAAEFLAHFGNGGLGLWYSARSSA
jgi:hypothetical protein